MEILQSLFSSMLINSHLWSFFRYLLMSGKDGVGGCVEDRISVSSEGSVAFVVDCFVRFVGDCVVPFV